MGSLGIYFGPKAISIVETKGKKLLKQTQIPQAALPAGELEEKVPPEAKMIEMVALFKDELRRSKIEAKEAALCLSGQDLIIRTFEIPQLPKEELASAINFEAKKYIPFKVEDLITDFQIEADKVTKTNLVLFIGIKKDTLEKYVTLLTQLDFKISTVEYSAFSLLRCLKLSNLSDEGVVAVIGADLLGEDEVNFTVLENGFPLFSRDIILAGGPLEAEKAPREPGMALEKLKTEIRISLDYYNRKFASKNIKKIYLFSNDEYRPELETFITQIGPLVQFVDITRTIESSPPYSLSFIKGFSVSLARTIKTNIKVNLLAAKEKGAAVKEKALAVEAAPLLEGMKINFKIVALGILICAATFGYGIYRMQPVKKDIAGIISARPQVSFVKPEASYEELTSTEAEFKRKLDTLNDFIKKQLFLTKPLNIIPRVMPKGVWLTRFSFDKREREKADLILDGASYLTSADEEFKAVNDFVSNLKANPEFTGYFKNINLTSIDRRQTGRITATNFSISCKTY